MNKPKRKSSDTMEGITIVVIIIIWVLLNGLLVC